MAVGNNDYFNQTAALLPSDGVHINQDADYPSGGADALTVSVGASATDDILVLRKGSTEAFVVQDGGNVVMTQTGAGDVGVVITQASAATADSLQIKNSAGTSLFVVDKDGDLSALPSITITGAAGAQGVILTKTGTGQTSFARLRLPILETAPASAGLTKGDIWLAKATTDTYRFALCVSTATGAVMYGKRIQRSTIGTTSH